MAPTYEEVIRHFAPPFDFEVYTGNLRNIGQGCLAAPHAGAIEAMTGEIMLATARVSGWSFYIFEGRLRNHNFKKLHITSTSFREPKLLALLAKTPFVLSFHGTSKTRTPLIFVGGLWDEGRRVLIRHLRGLSRMPLEVKDATKEPVAEEIAGRSPDNITNRGLSGRGVQLEFSKGARELFDPSSNENAKQNLRRLTKSLDRALNELAHSA